MMDDENYIPRRLVWRDDNSNEHTMLEGDLLSFERPLVILGAPGIGKTELMERLAKQLDTKFFRATSFLRQTDESIRQFEKLVIDGLDEVAAAEEGDPLHNVLKKLASGGRPPFIISCRVADWSNVTAKSDIMDDYGVQPLQLTLQPFNRNEALNALGNTVSRSDAESALTVLDETELAEIYENPLTLRLMSAVVTAKEDVPESRAELYAVAAEKLRLETPTRSNRTGLSHLSKDDALDAAGAAMAALILTGHEALTKQTQHDDLSGILSCYELSGLAPAEHVEAVLGSNLFKAYSVDGTFAPLHRTIAEYLGARWLARSVEGSEHKSRTASRLLGLISSVGGVPASLRGLHAWLAHFSPTLLAPHVIDADPYGVLRYGDVDLIAAVQARQLLRSLRSLAEDDPYFRSEHWGAFRARGLAQPDLLPDIREIITNAHAPIHLRSLIVEILKGSSLVEPLGEELKTIVLNPSRTFHERATCVEALAGISSSTADWRSIHEALISLADKYSLRLAVEMLTDVGLEHFSDQQIADAVVAETGILMPSEEYDRDGSIGGYFVLSRKMPEDRIPGVLDALAARILPTRNPEDWWDGGHWEARMEIAHLSDHLIARLFSCQSPNASAAQIWDWLRALAHERSYEKDDRGEISKFFETRSTLRREIQKLAILEANAPESYFLRAYHLAEVSSGLRLTDDDIRELLAEVSRRKDPVQREIWERLVGQLRGDKRLSEADQRLALPYAEGNDELVAFLEANPERHRLEDWEKKQRRNQRDRERKEKLQREKARAAFVEKLDEVRRGDFQWIVGPAKAYLGMFSDLNSKSDPAERVSEWLGEDVRDAALEGFEAVLHRDDLPSVVEIAEGFANSRVWNFVYPMIAGAAQRVASGRSLADLPPTLLSSIEIAAEHELIEKRSGIESLLPAMQTQLHSDAKLYERHVRQKFEPYFRSRSRNPSALYSFVRDVDKRPLSIDLSIEWLGRFPDLILETERELVGCVVSASMEGDSSAGNALEKISKQRLAGEFNDDRRSFWLSVLFLLDFDDALKRLPTIDESNRDLLWRLSEWHFDKHESRTDTPAPSVKRLSWLVQTFRYVWPVAARPRGATWGRENAWDATERIQWAILQLSRNPVEEAGIALRELREMPADGYTMEIQAAIARQRRAHLEANFTSPSLENLEAVLADASPRSAADVQSIVIDSLEHLNTRLQGDPLDIVNNFYDEAGRPKSENECRTQMLIALGTLPFDIQMPTEVAMPQGTRSDAAFSYGSYSVPLEAKGQWHKEVWTAASTQLDRLYSTQYRGATRGIYVVFWFGADAPPGKRLRLPPNNAPKPTSAKDMERMLFNNLPEHRKGSIAVLALDLTRPK